jgi:hypothetical protein
VNGDGWLPPEWFEVCQLAEAWHCPPWEIVDPDRPIGWRVVGRKWLETRARIREDANRDTDA